MDSKGNIQEFESEEAAKAAGFNESLDQAEYNQLKDLKEDERVFELAWIRFWATQKRTPSEKITMKFAFRSGFLTAMAIINAE
jgi:hypothetical protein